MVNGMVKPDFDTVMQRFRQRARERMEAFEAELERANNVAKEVREVTSTSVPNRKEPQRLRPRRSRKAAVRGVLRDQRA
ncbi:hypothetical protein [Corynebacterium sp. H130]|uniref:hypothetical protein n=1 Tax=Corynebacterium sp. H130 TaxID=3133444 RepID=UPI0030A59468